MAFDIKALIAGTAAVPANGNGTHENRGITVLQRQYEEKEAEKAFEAALAGLAYRIRKKEPDRDLEGMKETLEADVSIARPAHLSQEAIAGTIAWIADGAFLQVPMVVPKPVSGLPDVFVRNKIDILELSQLRERRRAHTENWVVDGWLARGELSMWSGKVEHGKTTLMRELVMCVLRGEPFLGHETAAGKVFYAMLDADGENLTYDEFEKVGLDDRDASNIRFLFEPTIARMENGPEQFFKALWDWRPSLVVIDPFARLKEIGDFTDYNNTYLMAMLSQYCKQIDAHFALPGHIPRGRPAGAAAATAAFGSVAFGAGVNARFVVERKEHTDVHVIRSSKGKSAGFIALEGEHVLHRDPDTGRISLGGAFSFKDQARSLKGKVYEFLQQGAGEEFTADAMAGHLGEMRGVIQAAANMLFEDGEIGRDGKGKRNSPYSYSAKANGPEKRAPFSDVQNRFFDD